MKVSKQARREAKALFRASLKNGVLDEPALLSTVKQVIEAKPRGYLAILEHLKRLVQLDLESHTAKIESAVSVSPELESRLRGQLANAYGPGLKITFAQNPALLGGMRVKVGSDVYDGSVQGRLAALQEQF